MKRKSFILHLDSLDVLDDLNNDQIAELFKAIRDYNSDEEVTLTGLMKAVFTPFKNQFNRDNESYLSVCERNKRNGSKGGRPKKQDSKVNPENPSGYLKTQDNPPKPKKADNDNNNDSDNKLSIDNSVDEVDFLQRVEHYQKEIGKGSSKMWIEGLYRTCKLKPKALNKIVDRFNHHLMIDTNGKYDKDFLEYRKHCGNWIRKQYELGKLSEFTTERQKGSI